MGIMIHDLSPQMCQHIKSSATSCGPSIYTWSNLGNCYGKSYKQLSLEVCIDKWSAVLD